MKRQIFKNRRKNQIGNAILYNDDTVVIHEEMERKAISTELNPEYYDDGLFYMKSIEYKINVPTLFDAI